MNRISTKLTLAAGIAIAFVMAIHAGFRVHRESQVFLDDVRNDHLVLGHALAETTAALIERAGPEEALLAVDEADRRRDHVEIRWLTTREAQPSAREVREGGERFFVTRIPVETAAGPAGVLELKESLAPHDIYLKDTVWRVTMVTLMTLLACAALVHFAGWLVLDRRLRPLVAGIRRIGEGDLSRALPRDGRDELAELGRELDEMRRHLAELSETAAREADARVSALEQLRHADRLSTVGKLAAGVAHELGTPLNVVSARAKMIEKGESEGEEIPDDARVIREQAERMTAIIRQLLDFARRRPAQRSPERLRELAASVLAMLRPHASKAQVDLRLEGEDAIEAAVDPGQLQQVLTNLVMNAIQAQPDGGEVVIALESEGEDVRLSVRDRGIGLDEEAKRRLFEPFFTTKDVGEGTGLGLSVVHGIVEEHGGKVAVAEAEGGGTVFTVTIPKELR
ncbi:MAG: hypothetical protein SangKO_053410 [Sandaracinaceae bacterium]